MKSYYPNDWFAMVQAFGALSQDLGENQSQERNMLAFLKEEIGRLQVSLKQAKGRTIQVPREFPPGLVKVTNDAIRNIQEQQLKLTQKLEQMIEDFSTANENEDRFVLLVFGEVNAGKSGIANHLAGCDFELPEELRLFRKMFVGDAEVNRLEEKAVECTSEYQGFCLPGLHWIDCPGVLSTTMKNSELAKSLLGRADFICFVSSSDAPLKESEMRELAKLVEENGAETVDLILLITKADNVIEDEDWETESIVRRLVKKEANKISEQIEWCEEQIKKSGIADYLKVIDLLPVSVYIARDQMGRDWETGGFQREPQLGWEIAYQESGINELCKCLTNIVTQHGATIKKNWPRKKEVVLRRLLSQNYNEARIVLEKLEKEVYNQRQLFLSTKEKVSHDAAILASGKVKDVLVDCGVDDLNRFDREKASVELKEVIRKMVTKGLEKYLHQVLVGIDTAMKDWSLQMDIPFDLRERTRDKSYKSKLKGECLGAAAGGIGGAAIGAILGPLGMIVGGAIGNYVGGGAGGYIYEENVTVKEKLGTNSDEVIIMTEKKVRELVDLAVNQIFEQLDNYVFDSFLKAVTTEKKFIMNWLDVFERLPQITSIQSDGL